AILFELPSQPLLIIHRSHSPVVVRQADDGPDVADVTGPGLPALVGVNGSPQRHREHRDSRRTADSEQHTHEVLSLRPLCLCGEPFTRACLRRWLGTKATKSAKNNNRKGGHMENGVKLLVYPAKDIARAKQVFTTLLGTEPY